MILDSVKSHFKNQYGTEPKLIKAPGRVNIIGEHTDYNLGVVLPASIEQGIYFAIQSNFSNTINIETHITGPERISFNLKGEHKPYEAFWGNYFKAIIEILIEKGYELKGFDCVFGGDIPIGSGLSSSAALCCGFIFGVAEVLDLPITKEENALIAQAAEHKVGLNCGLMDQYAVLFGKKAHALFLDCRNLEHSYVPINLEGYSWVLINSNIKHNLAVDSEYNKRRTSCERVVSHVQTTKRNATSLRDVSFEDLEDVRIDVGDVDYQRAKYVLEENQRVFKMMEVLRSGDAQVVGQILKAGHWAMSEEFEITTEELDFLVSEGEKIPSVLGSRMMGGGFGGCTINLIKTEEVESSLEAIRIAYKDKTDIDCTTYALDIGDGVHSIAQ